MKLALLIVVVTVALAAVGGFFAITQAHLPNLEIDNQIKIQGKQPDRVTTVGNQIGAPSTGDLKILQFDKNENGWHRSERFTFRFDGWRWRLFHRDLGYDDMRKSVK